MKTHTPFSRRDFLKSACLAGAAFAAAGLMPPTAFAASGRTGQQTRLLMGTMVTLTAVAPDSARAEDAFASAFTEIERQIAIFDRRNGASALGALNAGGRLADAPAELLTVLGAAARIGAVTEHSFNPAVAPLVALLASAGNGARPRYAGSDLQEALALSAPGGVRLAGRTVRLERSGMALTLDGIAKGFIADVASDALARQGLSDHVVNAGGDIRVRGNTAAGRPWTIGIQHPDSKNRIIASVAVSGGGIATSGSYENSYNAGRTRHHLVSHLTGKSPDISSVTVRAGTAMEADALATALALLPPAQALRFAQDAGASALIVDRQGRPFMSRGWA